MKKYLLTLLFSWLSVSLYGWEPDSFRKYKNSLSSFSLVYFGSDAISNRFALAYYRGEYIDEAMKDAVSEKLDDKNSFGTGFRAGLRYTFRTDTTRSGNGNSFGVALTSNYHVDSKFSKDAFELYFRGNKNYAGKEANLDDFRLQLLAWQSMTFSYGHTFNARDQKFRFSADAGIVKGQKLYTINTTRTKLFTASDGAYLDLDADVDIHQSDSSSGDLYAWNGTGASGGITVEWINSRGNQVSATLDGIGFIRWNNKSAFIHADTAFRFEGIDISDIFLLTDSIREPISLDSSLVEPYLTNRIKQGRTTPLPCRAYISYLHVLAPGRWYAEAGIGIMLYAGAVPEEKLSLYYIASGKHRFGISAVNGGYSGFRTGLACTLSLSKHFLLTLESDCLSSAVRKNGRAQGAFVSLTAGF